MKYLAIKPIKIALERVHKTNAQEHTTGTPISGLLNNYFPGSKFITTPEQIQTISNKRPDFTVEMLENEQLKPHVFVEIKSLINSNFNNILDQLHDTILYTVDLWGNLGGNFAVFIIAAKGTQIAFFEFYNFQDMLDYYEIENYKGFRPLGQLIPELNSFNINHTSEPSDYEEHLRKVDIPHDPEELKKLGVKSTKKIGHPHIWDLLNKEHEDYIHKLFVHMAENKAGGDIKD